MCKVTLKMLTCVDGTSIVDFDADCSRNDHRFNHCQCLAPLSLQTYYVMLFMNMFLSFSFITSCAQTSLPTSNQNLEINLYKQNMHTVILVCIRKLVVYSSLNFNLAVDIKYVIFQHFLLPSVYPHLSALSAHRPCQDHHTLASLL